MRAMRMGAPAGLDTLGIDQCDPGRPGPGEVLVRVRASSLNYHDYLVAVGAIPTEPGRVPMSDGAGEVVEVGPPALNNVHEPSTEFNVGDAVLGTFFRRWLEGHPTNWKAAIVSGEHVDGYAREFAVVPATSLTLAPVGLSPAEAATLPCAGLTAWRALVGNGALKPGDTVIVQGTGGVSVFALQFAKAIGASVIATSSSDEKLARLGELGADYLINYKREPKWGKAAKVWTGGRGVDHVVEVGGADTLDQSITACRMGGHIAMIGVLAGLAGKVSTARIMLNQIRLQGLTVGSRRDQLDMIRAIETIRLRPVLDRSFALEQLAAAFRYQQSGQHFGKIGVVI
ncbi:zinc-dependent alcohol dehydrogenase family protein [Paraburkholderia sp. RL17-347-BIC-D]|uniref:zinc-dependent alcohol dehydrogenase family protein n=1 Tax=Paraburkholderia sp. RL17-347-BIC-D TaxID=3031632 RepID=UPI0038BDE5D8